MNYIAKNILFNSIVFFISYSLNTIIIRVIDTIYIQSLWCCLCIWILSESHIIITDLKNSEHKYKCLYKDYIERLLILDSINDLKIKMIEIKKEIINNSPITEISPLNSCDVSNFTIPKINKTKSMNSIYNKSKYVSVEPKGRLNSTLGNKSCVF
jgi:hypothetical protein